MVLRDRRREAGLTLVEILVAAAVLGLALLALAPLFTNAVRTNASAYQMTNANSLAREKLEELSGYPRSDARFTVPAGSNAAGPTGAAITGATVGACADNPAPNVGTYCENDLPKWLNPTTGATSFAANRPGAGWFLYPYTRTYTVEQFDSTLATRVTAPGPYVVKLIVVTVAPTAGPFPGLRTSRQALYLRLRDVT